MSKSKYLRIVGMVELVASIISILFELVVMIALTAKAAWALSLFGLLAPLPGGLVFLAWVVFLFYCFLAPSVGILFLTVSELCEYPPQYSAPKVNKTVNSDGNRLVQLEIKINHYKLD